MMYNYFLFPLTRANHYYLFLFQLFGLRLENRLFRPIEEIVEDAEDVEDADVDVEEETRRNGSL